MDNNGSYLGEFWNILTRLDGDVTKCMYALGETPVEDEELRSLWRRTCALTVFAFLDGVTYCMAFHAYNMRRRPDVPFSLEELTRLGKMYDFDEDAEPAPPFNEARMLDDLRFVFNAFARVNFADYTLPVADPGWLHVGEVARIRARLQYARLARELEVSLKDVDALLSAEQWYMERVFEMLEICGEGLTAKAAELAGEDDVVM
jgi:hypothetical protein